MNESVLTFLTALHSAMTEQESFRIELTRKGDSMDMVIIPILHDNESKVPDAAKPIRAALSLPLSMSGMSLEAISNDMSERLQGYGQARAQTFNAYEELLASLKDATASAKNEAGKNAKKGGNKDKAESPDTVTTASTPATETQQAEQTSRPAIAPESEIQGSGGLLDY